MSYYGWNFDPYVSVAARKRRNADTVQKLLKKGVAVQPVMVEGRTIARTFWGKAWCKNIESYQDYENRLPRGRAYVREGAVLNLQINTGEIDALVAGSGAKPYEIKVHIETMPEDKWTELKKKCTGKISSLLTLLQGKLPEEILSEFCSQEHGLFPTPKEITMQCSCPDWSDLCKHLAAVLYAIGAKLDAEPKLFFTLRGLNENDLIGSEMVDALTEGTTPEIDANQLSDMFGVEFDQMEDVKNTETKAGTTAKTKEAKQSSSKSAAARKADTKKADAKNADAKKTDASEALFKKIMGFSPSLAKKDTSGGTSKPIASTPAASGAANPGVVSSWSAAQVKRLRLALGKTQQQFGDLLGVSGALISQIEVGRTPASQFVQERLQQLEASAPPAKAAAPATGAAVSKAKAPSRTAAKKTNEAKKAEPTPPVGVPAAWTGSSMRALRYRLKLSQTQMASKLSVYQGKISLMERGVVPLTAAQELILTELAGGAKTPKPNAPLTWDGARICVLRQKLAMSKAELARKLNVSAALVGKMESGKANISDATRRKLELLE